MDDEHLNKLLRHINEQREIERLKLEYEQRVKKALKPRQDELDRRREAIP